MNLCLYQGTFNPIHNAHLAAAKFVYENFEFDKILFIPAYRPPHKNDFFYDVESAKHRLNMVNLAIEPYPYFDLSEIEYKREAPSYTYLTIVELYRIYNLSEKINFIIGSDAFKNIESWHESEKLKKLIDFILFVREDDFNEDEFIKLKQKGYNYRLAAMPYIDIASSEIRNKVKQCAKINDMVPEQVERYIKENEVYRY